MTQIFGEKLYTDILMLTDVRKERKRGNWMQRVELAFE